MSIPPYIQELLKNKVPDAERHFFEVRSTVDKKFYMTLSPEAFEKFTDGLEDCVMQTLIITETRVQAYAIDKSKLKGDTPDA